MLLKMLGVGATNAIAGEQTEGVVEAVKTCWWIKINTKPVRRHMMDGAVFPHMIHFAYTVESQTYRGKRYVRYYKRCPEKGEKLTVYYEREKPANYAVIL